MVDVVGNAILDYIKTGERKIQAEFIYRVFLSVKV